MKEVTVNEQRQIRYLSGITLIAVDYFGTMALVQLLRCYFGLENSLYRG
jgi:hypothetical protein